MSVYNAENTIESSVKSILNQAEVDLEFLICDDASDDRTHLIITKLQKLDPRIKIFKNKTNIGLTKSLNLLLKKTEFSYVARQDADDISVENRLISQIRYIEHRNLVACTSLAITQQTNKIIPRYSAYFPLKLVIKYKNPFIHGTLMISKDALNNIGGYDERFVYAQDYKLMQDLFLQNYKVGILKKPLYLLNIENNISTIHKEKQAYYAECVRKKEIPL
jgi:glycosyltransferase involved in cell wall biosynthesis